MAGRGGPSKCPPSCRRIDAGASGVALALFAHRGASRVRRYPMPGLAGMNLVIDDVLQGGVNGALNLDGHGKTLSFLLLGMTVAVK
jgi:hypothetical protein